MKIKYFNFSLPLPCDLRIKHETKNRYNAAGGDDDDEDDEGVVCYCPYGYELTEDETGCQDVNECEIYGEEENSDDDDDDGESRNQQPKATFCSHSCTNLIGKLNGTFLFECTLLMFIICFISTFTLALSCFRYTQDLLFVRARRTFIFMTICVHAFVISVLIYSTKL